MDSHRLSPIRIWHLIRVRPRLAISVGVAALACILMPAKVGFWARVLLTWDIGAGLYLILAWILMGRTSLDGMRWRARVQDDGAAAILALTVVGALASLAAIVLELSGLKIRTLGVQGLHLGLGVGTLLASWLLVHTSFALHYAHAYYASLSREGAPPLEFPRQESPVYLDFLYFSVVIGMTSQTADVAIATTRMRRLVMVHGLIAFLFNTTLLALAINIAAGLLG